MMGFYRGKKKSSNVKNITFVFNFSFVLLAVDRVYDKVSKYVKDSVSLGSLIHEAILNIFHFKHFTVSSVTCMQHSNSVQHVDLDEQHHHEMQV